MYEKDALAMRWPQGKRKEEAESIWGTENMTEQRI
jgi:hypothetical protein